MDAHFDGAIEQALRCVGCPNLALKPEQIVRQSVRHVYEGKDVFVWLPTGFDKCYAMKCYQFILDVKRGTDDGAVICSQTALPAANGICEHRTPYRLLRDSIKYAV